MLGLVAGLTFIIKLHGYRFIATSKFPSRFILKYSSLRNLRKRAQYEGIAMRCRSSATAFLIDRSHTKHSFVVQYTTYTQNP